MLSLPRPFQRNAWLLVAIGVFLLGTIVSAYRIYQTQAAIFWNYRTGTWLVVEAQTELQNALMAAKTFRIEPSEVARDELAVRFDVFWSRIPLILDSQEGVDIRRIDAIVPNTHKVLAELPLLDEDLERIQVGDIGSVKPFERRLASLAPLFEEMTRVVLVQDELRYRSGSLLKEMWWTVAAFLLAISAGVVLIIGNLINTRRIRNLLAQREAIERVQATQLAAIESSGEGIAMFDAEGRLGYSNEAFHQLIGDDFTRTLNLRSWRRFLTRDGARTLLRGLRQANRQMPWKGEIRGRTLAGAERDWEAHIMRRREEGFVAVIRDLTDRKAAEREHSLLQQQLHRVEKMDAVGRLAGGVAHDFNNILAAILGFGSLLELDLEDRPEQRHMAQQILNAAERGKELVQSIMTFSRTEKSERAVVEVGAICREAATMAALSIPGPAVFETEIEPRSLPVVGNATQINRAILNLCINARDALEGNRGTVRLEVARVLAEDAGMIGSAPTLPAAQQAVVSIDPISETQTRAWVGGAGKVAEFYARIRVMDDGSGISRGIMEKMFDPFFTTKDVGRGTGLGLASVLGIVKAHGGAIAVDSTIGKGSIFDILLPLQAAPTETAQAQAAAGKESATVLSDMHVLLVDDDPGAGNALGAILQKVGCEVSYVASGAEALAVVVDEPDWFDLVVTDLAMPEMSGLDLASRLREHRFARPIVLASARLQDASLEERARAGIEYTIAKPFTLSEVAAVIWSIAGARATKKIEENARAGAARAFGA
ncbi:response regulator [Dongia deserti]|uniref:response regulator n=1 Tax=Dongia deserti TaxID=2268030 RepID=UPI000E64E703|nr:response regulator [Dongia deserti]